MTKQKFIRACNLEPTKKYECAEYIIPCVKYLRTVEELPVNYISSHNEEENFSRWPTDRRSGGSANHKHNLHWPSARAVDSLGFIRRMLKRQGRRDVGLTPAETTGWYRFATPGYAT